MALILFCEAFVSESQKNRPLSFETMLANENNITLELIDSLMPWSKEIPEEFYIRDTKKRTKTK